MVIIEEDGIISLVNAEFEKMFGYSRAEVEGRRGWTTFFTPEEVDRMREYNNRRLANPQEELGHHEFRIFAKDGRSKDVFIILSSVPGTDEKHRFPD